MLRWQPNDGGYFNTIKMSKLKVCLWNMFKVSNGFTIRACHDSTLTIQAMGTRLWVASDMAGTHLSLVMWRSAVRCNSRILVDPCESWFFIMAFLCLSDRERPARFLFRWCSQDVRVPNSSRAGARSFSFTTTRPAFAGLAWVSLVFGY